MVTGAADAADVSVGVVVDDEVPHALSARPAANATATAPVFAKRFILFFLLIERSLDWLCSKSVWDWL